MNELDENKVVENGNKLKVYLNLPTDLIYDIDEIVMEYDTVSGEVSIVSHSIPTFIKDNMKRSFTGDVKKYIKFLESNLDVFFKGDVPEYDVQDVYEADAEKRTRPHELPKDYKFPVGVKTLLNVSLEVEKRSVFIVVCGRINVQVECNRCKKTCNMTGSVSCPGCGSLLEMRYIASFDLEFLGFLNLRNCRFVCFNPAAYQFNCDKCSMNYETDELGIGSAFRLKCYGCSADMLLKIIGIRFIQQKKDTLKAGQPLPDKGTCKHYKKSYRWFRFPCCSSLYPCDICHDEESGHAHQMANKMVCGLCSREQGVNNTCECGMSLKKSAKFWEGGKGSRNKATMSRKDSKKYTK